MLLVLLLLLIPLLFLESLVGALLLRRWTFVKASFWNVLLDCWRMRGHVAKKRKETAGFRLRSDFWMLRFLRLRLNRWDEVKRTVRFGLPRVDAR